MIRIRADAAVHIPLPKIFSFTLAFIYKEKVYEYNTICLAF